MERKLSLIRAILLEVEQHQEPTKAIAVRAPGHAPEQIAYHVRLLHEAGYVDAVDLSTMNELAWLVKTLTWKGHEFLDATRTATVWQQVLARLKDRGVDVPFNVIQRLAAQIGASMLGVD